MTVANDLDRKITIRRAGEQTGSNEWNEPIYSPAVEFTVSAHRQDVSDGERMAAGSVGGYRMTRFTVRHTQRTAGIRPSDELEHEGRQHNIVGVKEVSEGRRKWLEITTSVSAD